MKKMQKNKSVELDLQIGEGVEVSNIPEQKLIQMWVEKSIINPQNQIEVILRIVCESEMTDLNQTYRNKSGPTNVLAFPSDVPPEYTPIPLLGDLIVCEPVIRAEALEQSKTLEQHWAHMVIHGMLHLQGFDHQSDVQATEMEAEETRILGQCDIANPYQEQSTIGLS